MTMLNTHSTYMNTHAVLYNLEKRSIELLLTINQNGEDLTTLMAYKYSSSNSVLCMHVFEMYRVRTNQGNFRIIYFRVLKNIE